MTQDAVQRALQTAIAHHQAGQLAEAERAYRWVLAEFPDHPDALHLLGVLAGQTGHADQGIELIGRAITINPGVAEYHSNLGRSYQSTGQPDAALVSLGRALELKPDLADAHINLGQVLSEMGRADEAIDAFRRAIALNPAHAVAHANLGALLQAAGRHGEAVASFIELIRLRPDQAGAYNDLGVALHASGRLEDAIAAFTRTIHLKPDHAQAFSNLGVALRDLGRVDEALAAFRRAIELNPGLAKTHINLGALLIDSGQIDEAVEWLRQAIQLNPGLAEAHHNLGIALYRTNRLDEAIDAYGRAVELDPEHAVAYSGMGVAALVSGRHDLAHTSFRRCLALRPNHVTAHSNLLLCEQYRPGVTLAGLASAHAEWDQRHAARLRGTWWRWDLVADPQRPLRLGFVSADFRTHPVGCFLVPVLENLAPHSCEVVCYNNRAESEHLTRRLAAAANEWHDVFGLDDDALAERIRADRIDMLFDLSGHTEGNRLLVFARRPAPIQITWIGYAATTGLSAIDYLIADRFHVPPELEPHYRERILRMPDAYVCFDPPGEAPAVGPLPALAKGYVTFGSFNNLAKLSPEVILTWAEILRRLPGARLMLVTRGLGDAGTRKRIHEAFAAAGADPERVELRGKMLRRDLLVAYNAMDLALDPFPYSGGITTCEALWMGVPVVTCPGETFASRHAFGHLSTVGLTETIVPDRREYVEQTVRLAEELPHLAGLRAGLREQMRGSPLCDGERFARHFLELLRGVWRQWCRE